MSESNFTKFALAGSVLPAMAALALQSAPEVCRSHLTGVILRDPKIRLIEAVGRAADRGERQWISIIET
jgi:hypothetical protein